MKRAISLADTGRRKERPMKRIGLCVGILVWLLSSVSCSTYYYSTLSSADRAGDRTPAGEFVQENDTARVIYRFSGEDAPVHITIYNKLDEPLYVDWRRSAIIIDDQATSYSPDALLFEDEAGLSSSELAMIPPRAMIQHQPLTLADFSFNKIPKSEYRQVKFPDAKGDYADLYVKEYTLEDSPLYFRSYITLLTGGRGYDLPQSLVFEKSFYISQLVRAGGLSPKHFTPTAQNAGDTFYVRYVKGRTLGYTMLSVVIIAGAVAVEVAVDPNERY